MLNSTIYGNVKSSFDLVIDMLGVEAVWTHTKTNATGKMVVGCTSLGKDDNQLINAYGISSKVLTAKLDSFKGGPPPEKFDTFVIKGEKFVAAAVHPIHLNTTLIGYKIMTNGK